MEVGEKLTEYLVTMAARTLKDPVHRVFVDIHNPGGGADTVTFGQTPHYSLNHLLLQVEAEKHRVATFRESGFTGLTPEQLCVVFPIDIIADDVALSLLCIILAFLVGAIALRYFHSYPFDYRRLW
jgi:hypothetical protein